MAARAAEVSTARACALRVVERVFEQGAYADRALTAEAAGLDARERSLATRIAYGTVQRRATLDHVAQVLVRRPLEQLEPIVLAALRIGLFQLLYMERLPTHAVVDETVELAKRHSRGGAGLVNAVLRRAAREDGALLADLDDRSPDGAALMHSVPEWLAQLWWDELGAEDARALMRQINEPAEAALRVNTLVASREEVVEALPVPARPAPAPDAQRTDLAEGLVLDGPFDIHGSDLWERGAVMPQSRASMLVSRRLGPRPGERVLDLCAAPGGKTTHLAALIEDRGRVLAVERHPGRARALEENCRRMAASCVEVRAADAAEFALGDGEAGFDRVLVDPPCSGLGTLQSRPDRRWRASPESIGELAALQARILAAGAAATRPGGALIYSVCTISHREGRGVVDAFLRANPCWDAEEALQLLPHRHGTDGFYIARLARSPS
jgi:16S rRNA (cytosine967-C5)-methyltransferase